MSKSICNMHVGVSWRSSSNANVPLRVRRSTRSPGMEGTPSKMPAPGAALAEAAELFNYNLPQRTQIDHRVSVVFPDDGERLTFGGAKGVWRGRSGHRL